MTLVDSFVALAVGAIASILITGAVAKTVDDDSFHKTLADNPLTRTSAALQARAVPVVEIGIGLVLLFARDIRWPALVGGVLFTGFLVVTATSPAADCMRGPFVPKRSPVRIGVNATAAAILYATAMRGPDLDISSRLLGFGVLAVVGLVAMVISANAAARRHHAAEPHNIGPDIDPRVVCDECVCWFSAKPRRVLVRLYGVDAWETRTVWMTWGTLRMSGCLGSSRLSIGRSMRPWLL